MAKNIDVGGFTLTPYRAAIRGKEAFVADLHIGSEEISLVTSRMQTAKMLERIKEMVEEYKVKRIIFAGDIKHSFGKKTGQEWEEVIEFFKAAKEIAEPIVLKGNHDFYIQNMLSRVDITVRDYYENDLLICQHGHLDVWKKDKDLIIGNEHPSLLLRDEVGVKVKLPAYLWFEKEKVLVLPAFNPLTKGTDVRDIKEKPLSPLLRFVDFKKGRVFGIDEEGKEVLDFSTVKDLEKWL